RESGLGLPAHTRRALQSRLPNRARDRREDLQRESRQSICYQSVRTRKKRANIWARGAVKYSRRNWMGVTVCLLRGQTGVMWTCGWRIPNFMRRLESDTVLDSVFATDTNPVLPLPVIFQHLTLASILLIRRALGGRYNHVGMRTASSSGPPLSRTASGPDIPSGSCRSAARQMDGRAAYKEQSLFL